MQTVQEFYGPAYARAKDEEKLLGAYKTFELALRAETPGIADRALTLAAKKEAEAFA